MKISCPACAAKYSIADEKVHDRLAKIRCRKCGTTIVIDGKNKPFGVLDVHAQRGGVAARAHRPEAGGVHRLEQPRLHRREDRLGIGRAVGTQRGLLGELGAVVEGASDSHPDVDRRAVLRAGLQHAVHDVLLDLLQHEQLSPVQVGNHRHIRPDTLRGIVQWREVVEVEYQRDEWA